MLPVGGLKTQPSVGLMHFCTTYTLLPLAVIAALGNHRAKGFERRLDALLRGACMVDLGAAADHVDAHRLTGAQHLAPWKLARPFVELREVKGHEAADPHQHPARAAQL